MIPDDIVEKAARALNLEAGRLRGLTMDDDWETITEGERGGWRLCARAALESVEGDFLLWLAQEEQCTCSEDRNGGNPEDHAASCAWAIAVMQRSHAE